jgi:flagellar basal-body rod modification protein FlgD
MTDPIKANTSAATATTPEATPHTLSANSALDRNAFLKLLIAQLSNQDPLQPTQGTEFVTQLAQFAVVEQSQDQSSKLDSLSTQVGGLANNAATTLVGKQVSVRGHGLTFDGVTATSSSVALAGPAASVTATVQDSSGRTVRTLHLGARPAGPLQVTWDGRDDHGQPATAGSYSLQVTAATADGRTVGVSQDVSGVVTRVAYDQGTTSLQLDNGGAATLSDLTSVGAAPTR